MILNDNLQVKFKLFGLHKLLFCICKLQFLWKTLILLIQLSNLENFGKEILKKTALFYNWMTFFNTNIQSRNSEDLAVTPIFFGTATFCPYPSVPAFLSRLGFRFRILAFLPHAKNITVPHLSFLSLAQTFLSRTQNFCSRTRARASR